VIDSLDELRSFLRIVDEGSLSAAARSLQLSVNAVSHRLAQLEARLGVQLAERSTRRVALTDEGQRFAERCRVILAEVDDAEEEVRPRGGKLRGTVRVAAHPFVITVRCLESVAGLLAEHDQLSVQLLARNHVVDPVAEGFDVVIGTGDAPFQHVVTRSIAHVEWALAASPAYVKRHGSPKSTDDLASHECLRALRTRSESHWVLKNARGQERSVKVGGHFESDDTATLLAAVYAGLGIGFRPDGEVRREAARGKLVHVLPGWTSGGSGVRVQMLTPPGRLRLSRVRVVADILARELAELE